MPEDLEEDETCGRTNAAYHCSEATPYEQNFNSLNSGLREPDYPSLPIDPSVQTENGSVKTLSASNSIRDSNINKRGQTQISKNIQTATTRQTVQPEKVEKSFINSGFVETEAENFSSELGTALRTTENKVNKICDSENNEKSETEKQSTSPVLWTQIIGAFAGASVHLCIGTVMGFTGVTLPSMMDSESQDIVLDKFEASMFSSIINVGALFGSLLSSLLMVWMGQRSTLLVFMPVGMLMWVIMGFAQSVWLLLFCRVMHGLVIGVSAGCANNYVVEIAHSSVRGRLSALTDLSRQSGFLFVYLVGSTSMTWRNVGLVCGLIAMALPFTGMLFLPHSPRWLAIRGRIEEAEAALTFFRGSNYDVASEMKDIKKQLNMTDRNMKVTDQLKMLKQRSILVRFIILAVLLYSSHFTGNFAMITYSVSIFASADVSISSYLCTILAAVTRIIGVLIYIIFADRFGRRPLFMIPLSLSGVCMVFLGFFFYVKLYMDDVSFLSWLPLTSLVLYTLFTCMSHPVLLLMRSELLPTSVRAVGVGLLYFVFFCGTFSVAISYPYMVDTIGSHWTFWIYGATSFTMVIISAIFIPETQGKSLEEIDELFEKKKPKPEP